MKRTIRTTSPRQASVPEPAVPDDRTASDDELEIRYSLTALGELAVAQSDRTGRGRRFRGFGPCGAVA
jgi:hypothetical protein